ncbi:hypothetical protein [Klebsiella oxytoca]|nr:hypothetical protein [Klebsiella oxytoca]MCW9502470.1 hypothetical protein [Klebsiella oxytoca]MDM4532148.1 hypothetical protein [Klebsiella oxytoca]
MTAINTLCIAAIDNVWLMISITRRRDRVLWYEDTKSVEEQ